MQQSAPLGLLRCLGLRAAPRICYQYIELNPARTGFCRRARDYQWSTHCYHAYGEYNRVVTPHQKYLALADSEKVRRRRYRRWFREEQSEEELAAMRGTAPETA